MLEREIRVPGIVGETRRATIVGTGTTVSRVSPARSAAKVDGLVVVGLVSSVVLV